jgi:heme-degrading monooxygenase HmoA
VFARVTTFEGAPGRIDEGLRIYAEEVIPWLRDATGFRGFVALVDREGQKSLGITFWATKEDMAADATRGGALRDEVAATVQTTRTSLEYYEVGMVKELGLDELG